jgi:hypothetical protein
MLLDATGERRRRLRHHDEAHQDRRRGAEHRGDHQMGGGVGDHGPEHGGIDHQHRAGNAGHAAGHHDEEFAAREMGEIRLDEQRRLDHAEEDVGRGRKTDSAAHPQSSLQQRRKAAHDWR